MIKYVEFWFQNLGNGRKEKNRLRQITFGLINRKKFNSSKIYGEHFFIIKTKSSLTTSAFIFATISQIKKKNFMYFGHKYLESGPSCLHKLATFLK